MLLLHLPLPSRQLSQLLLLLLLRLLLCHLQPLKPVNKLYQQRSLQLYPSDLLLLLPPVQPVSRRSCSCSCCCYCCCCRVNCRYD
jgi:hypothetical protein